MAGGEHVDFSTSNSLSTQTESNSNQESNNDPKKELEVLWRRVKTTASLLTHLKSKAKTITNPQLTLTHSNFNHPEVKSWIDINPIDEQDEVYTNEVVKIIQMVTDLMDTLLERVIMAESETCVEKQKAAMSQEEVIKKEIQIEIMSEKLGEMDRFAVDTKCVLKEMKEWVDNLVEETSRQRQRASENQEELIRVKRDFEALNCYVNSLISVRDTLVSSEKQFQDMEKLFERLVVKTTQLETEKNVKEGEVQKLMEENMRLNGLLDQKESQLLAMNEQCKFMALSASHF